MNDSATWRVEVLSDRELTDEFESTSIDDDRRAKVRTELVRRGQTILRERPE